MGDEERGGGIIQVSPLPDRSATHALIYFCFYFFVCIHCARVDHLWIPVLHTTRNVVSQVSLVFFPV